MLPYVASPWTCCCRLSMIEFDGALHWFASQFSQDFPHKLYFKVNIQRKKKRERERFPQSWLDGTNSCFDFVRSWCILHLSCRLQLMQASSVWFVARLHCMVTDSWSQNVLEVREAETGSKMPSAFTVFPNVHVHLEMFVLFFLNVQMCIAWD